MPKKLPREITITWRPQPRQATFLDACGLLEVMDGGPAKPPAARFIGYGGSAGGGKTDALLGLSMIAGLHWRRIKIGYFRREFPQLEGPGGAIMRSRELMTGWADYNGEHHRWTYPTGSILQFCHCKEEQDVYNYQSQMFDILLFDEVTQFPRFIVRYLLSRNRLTVDLPDLKSAIAAAATNPGNVGHAWFRSEFVDIGPPEVPADVQVEPGRLERHVFIPAKLADNQILEQRDPGYRATLEAMPEITRKQLLDGDWNAFSGQYFASWRPDLHVKPTPRDMRAWLEQTRNHKKFRCLDYGLDCTACYWVDVAPSGLLTVYRELYKPDLILSRAAKAIVGATTDAEQIAYTVASPDLWNRRQDGGVPGEETMRKAGLAGLRPADNRRVPGWEHMAEWLEPYIDPEWAAEMAAKGMVRCQDPDLGLGWRSVDGSEQYFDERDGRKLVNLVFFDCCGNAIKQIPSLIRDDDNPNNVSDKAPDHAGEAIRYGLMSRPKPAVIKPDPLAALRDKFPEWSLAYRAHKAELLRGDPSEGVTLEDLGM